MPSSNTLHNMKTNLVGQDQHLYWKLTQNSFMPVLKEGHENSESCLISFSSLNSSPKIVNGADNGFSNLYKTQQKEEIFKLYLD